MNTITWNVALGSGQRRLLAPSDGQVLVIVVSVGEPMVSHLDSVIYKISTKIDQNKEKNISKALKKITCFQKYL